MADSWYGTPRDRFPRPTPVAYESLARLRAEVDAGRQPSKAAELAVLEEQRERLMAERERRGGVVEELRAEQRRYAKAGAVPRVSLADEMDAALDAVIDASRELGRLQGRREFLTGRPSAAARRRRAELERARVQGRREAAAMLASLGGPSRPDPWAHDRHVEPDGTRTMTFTERAS